MSGKKGQGRSVARPYGLWIRVKGPEGPIRTEKWFENSSDRNRDLDRLRAQHRATMLGSGKLGK